MVFVTINTAVDTPAYGLNTPEGMEILHKLLAGADVFLTNNRAKALEAMGETEVATGTVSGFDEMHNMKGIQFYIKGFQGGSRVDVAAYSAPAK